MIRVRDANTSSPASSARRSWWTPLGSGDLRRSARRLADRTAPPMAEQSSRSCRSGCSFRRRGVAPFDTRGRDEGQCRHDPAEPTSGRRARPVLGLISWLRPIRARVPARESRHCSCADSPAALPSTQPIESLETGPPCPSVRLAIMSSATAVGRRHFGDQQRGLIDTGGVTRRGLRVSIACVILGSARGFDD